MFSIMHQFILEEVLRSREFAKFDLDEFLILKDRFSDVGKKIESKSLSINSALKSFNTTIKTHPFYKRMGFSSVDLFEKIPILNKQRLRNFSIESDISPEFDNNIIWHRATSGTKGIPIKMYFDTGFHASLKYTTFYNLAQNLSLFDSDFISNKVVCYGISDYPLHDRFLVNLCPFTKKNIFIQERIDINKSKELLRCIKFINKYQPLLIRCKPYILSILSDFIHSKKISLSYKPILISSGGTLNKDKWDKIETILDCKLINLFGCTEVGIFAYQLKGRLYTISDKDVIIEFLNEEKIPVKHGERGILTITSKRNKLFPLYRYQTGDFGCKSIDANNELELCGHELVLFKNKRGIFIPPGHFSLFLTKMGIEKFKIIQKKDYSLLILIPFKGISFTENVKIAIETKFGMKVKIEKLRDMDNKSKVGQRFISYLS